MNQLHETTQQLPDQNRRWLLLTRLGAAVFSVSGPTLADSRNP